jgi:hypothetical protein
MPTYKSKAEERRAEMLSKRPRIVGRKLVHPIGCVCVACHVKDDLGRDEEIAAAERAVVDAAMNWHATRHGQRSNEERSANAILDDACAALARLREGE